MSIVNVRLAVAFEARRAIVKMRYIGDVGASSRMTARTSGTNWSARVDFMTYAGDPAAAGRYTIGSGDVLRRSSTFTSSTTPTTVYHVCGFAAGRTCLPIASSFGNNSAA